jgi:hypothetical protein
MSDRPEDVHPDYQQLTPENAEDWSEDQKARYSELKEQQLHAEAQENTSELAKDERETLEVLRSTTTDEPLTEEVNLGAELDGDDAYVTVTKRVSGALEEKFDAITEEQQSDAPRIGRIKDTVIDAILLLIVDDDEPDADAYNFQSRQVWESYYYDAGSEGLMEVFEVLADPALSRYEQLGNSRGGTSPRTSRR